MLRGKQATFQDAPIPLWQWIIKLFSCSCKAKQSDIWNNAHVSSHGWKSFVVVFKEVCHCCASGNCTFFIPIKSLDISRCILFRSKGSCDCFQKGALCILNWNQTWKWIWKLQKLILPFDRICKFLFYLFINSHVYSRFWCYVRGEKLHGCAKCNKVNIKYSCKSEETHHNK